MMSIRPLHTNSNPAGFPRSATAHQLHEDPLHPSSIQLSPPASTHKLHSCSSQINNTATYIVEKNYPFRKTGKSTTKDISCTPASRSAELPTTGGIFCETARCWKLHATCACPRHAGPQDRRQSGHPQWSAPRRPPGPVERTPAVVRRAASASRLGADIVVKAPKPISRASSTTLLHRALRSFQQRAVHQYCIALCGASNNGRYFLRKTNTSKMIMNTATSWTPAMR